MKFKHGGKVTALRCLIDNGAMRSYIKGSALSKLGVDRSQLKTFPTSVKTFLSVGSRNVSEIVLSFDVSNNSSFISSSFFVEDNLDLDFEVRGLQAALRNLRPLVNNKPADPRLFRELTNKVEHIEVLLGGDILCDFPSLSYVR